MDTNRAAMTTLRICVWLIPGFILIIAFMLMVRMEGALRFAMPLIFCAFIALGYFDMRLKLQIEKADPKPLKKSVFGWAVAFAFAQIIIAPAVIFALAYIYFTILDQPAFFP